MRMLTTREVQFEARCRAFASEGIRTHKIAVDPVGRVWVWDDNTNDFTSLHVLLPRTIYRLRRQARDIEREYLAKRDQREIDFGETLRS